MKHRQLNQIAKAFLLAAFFPALANIAFAQSGGNYAVTQSVIAAGGGTVLDAVNNPTFSVTGTAGQAVAGTRSTNPPFVVTGGFWTASAGGPTAASVTIGGRVLSRDGRGVRNVLVTLVEADGTSRTILTGAFGYFRFNDVSVGQTILINVAAKRFKFNPDVLALTVVEEVQNIDFTAMF